MLTEIVYDGNTKVTITPARARDIKIREIKTERKEALKDSTLSPQKRAGLKRKAENDIYKAKEYYQKIIDARKPKIIEISVDWTQGGMYGMQAKATVRLKTGDWWKTYTGDLTGGCGYDKLSTAVAHAFNNSPEMIKLAFQARDYSVGGLATHPLWAGGVGISSFERTLKTLGYKKIASHSSKFNDYYTFNLK